MTPEQREKHEDNLKALLDDNGIEYDGRLGIDKLEEVVKEAGLEVPDRPKDDPVQMQGGAAVQTVEVKPIIPAVGEDDETIQIVTTAPGTLGPGGIVPVGTKATIKQSAFSKIWMRKL